MVVHAVAASWGAGVDVRLDCQCSGGWPVRWIGYVMDYVIDLCATVAHLLHRVVHLVVIQI